MKKIFSIYLFLISLGISAYPIPYSIEFPDNSDKPLPAVILLHTSGGKYSTSNMTSFYRKKGYVVYMPDFFQRHGITPKTRHETWTTYKEEIKKELEEIVELMKMNPSIDPNNIFAVGFSNGGYWATYLAGKGLVNAAASHFGVWNEYLGRGRTRCGSDDPADFLSPTSSPVLALHPKYDSVQRLECVEKGWDRARRNGFDKLEIHIYPDKDVTHAWHTENRKKNYHYNQAVLNDSTERTDIFFRKFMK